MLLMYPLYDKQRAIGKHFAYSYEIVQDRCYFYFTKPQEVFCKSLLAAQILENVVISGDFTKISFVILHDSFRPFPDVTDNGHMHTHDNNTSHLCTYGECVKFMTSLGRQISSLESLQHTFAWLDRRDIFLVNKQCIYMGVDSICLINKNRHFTLSCMVPSSPTHIFLAPEVKNAESIPSQIYHTAVYYSLGAFANYCLSGDTDPTFVSNSFGLAIIDTKLYWFVLRCIHATPDKRLMLFL